MGEFWVESLKVSCGTLLLQVTNCQLVTCNSSAKCHTYNHVQYVGNVLCACSEGECAAVWRTRNACTFSRSPP